MVYLHKRQLLSVFVVHPRDATSTTNPAFIDNRYTLPNKGAKKKLTLFLNIEIMHRCLDSRVAAATS